MTDDYLSIAHRLLDVPNADPDDDVRTMARNFIRAHERAASLEAKLREAEALCERLKLEAQIHAQEARTANATRRVCDVAREGDAMSENKPRKILRNRDLDERGCPSRVQRWRLIRENKFPAPIQLSPNSIGFYEDEIEQWLESRPRVAYAPSTPEVA